MRSHPRMLQNINTAEKYSLAAHSVDSHFFVKLFPASSAIPRYYKYALNLKRYEVYANHLLVVRLFLWSFSCYYHLYVCGCILLERGIYMYFIRLVVVRLFVWCLVVSQLRFIVHQNGCLRLHFFRTRYIHVLYSLGCS